MSSSYAVGLIRVVSFDEPELLNLHGRIIEQHFPQLKVESQAIPDQPFGIHDDATEALAVPKIIELAKQWHGIDALIISCAGDPGVEQLRSTLDIPVIGAGEATATLARRYGHTFGVLGITKEVPGAYQRLLGSNIVGPSDVPGVESTLDLMQDSGREQVVRRAQELEELGAEVIALACTGMATIGIARELQAAIGIPVIDPVLAEGLIAYFECLRVK